MSYWKKSNTIELTVHTSCYWVLDLLCVNSWDRNIRLVCYSNLFAHPMANCPQFIFRSDKQPVLIDWVIDQLFSVIMIQLMSLNLSIEYGVKPFNNDANLNHIESNLSHFIIPLSSEMSHCHAVHIILDKCVDYYPEFLIAIPFIHKRSQSWGIWTLDHWQHRQILSGYGCTRPLDYAAHMLTCYIFTL